MEEDKMPSGRLVQRIINSLRINEAKLGRRRVPAAPVLRCGYLPGEVPKYPNKTSAQWKWESNVTGITHWCQRSLLIENGARRGTRAGTRLRDSWNKQLRRCNCVSK